jgi:hypothetical protein
VDLERVPLTTCTERYVKDVLALDDRERRKLHLVEMR